MKSRRIATRVCVALVISGFIATPSHAQAGRWAAKAFRAAMPSIGKTAVGVSINVASALLINVLTPKVVPQSTRSGPKSTILSGLNATPQPTPSTAPDSRPKFAAFYIDFVANGSVVDANTGLIEHSEWKHKGVFLFSGDQGYIRLVVSENDETVDQVVEQDAFVSITSDGTLRVQGSNPRALAGELNYEADSFYLRERPGGDFVGETAIAGGGTATIYARFLGVGTLPDLS
jgi:hypothetical protein